MIISLAILLVLIQRISSNGLSLSNRKTGFDGDRNVSISFQDFQEVKNPRRSDTWEDNSHVKYNEYSYCVELQ